MKKCQKLRIGLFLPCVYHPLIFGSSSAHLRLISKTEIGIKKRPIIKIPLCCKDKKKYGKCGEDLRMCIFFCTFARYLCKPICNHTHGKTDTHSHHHHRCMRGATVHTHHTAKKWEVQQRTYLAKQANETRPHTLRHFARQRNTPKGTKEATSKTIIAYEQ